MSFQVFQIDQTVNRAFDGDGLETGDGRARRIGAVCAVGDEHASSLFTAILKIGGSDQQRSQFAMGAGGRLQRHHIQPGDFRQKGLHIPEQFQHALATGVGLQRVQIGYAGQPGKTLVALGVVFHRARTERVKVRVDGHVSRRKIHEMANEIDLADLGKWWRRIGQHRSIQQLSCRGTRHVTRRQQARAAARMADIEQEIRRLIALHILKLLCV